MAKKTQEEENPNSEYGQAAQYDHNFKGPVKNRGCTDIICCILFLLVIIGYIVVGVLAWIYGDPRDVLYARNSTGWFCGTDPTCFTLTFSNVQCPYTQLLQFVCVKECPSDFWAVRIQSYVPNVEPATVFNPNYCVPSLNLNDLKNILTPYLWLIFHFCSVWLVLGRCFPDIAALGNIPKDFENVPGLSDSVNDTVALIKNGTGFNAKDIATRIFADFASSWPWIILGLVIAMLVSLLFLLLLRFTAPVMVWVLIFGVLAAGAYGIWHCAWEYQNYKQNSATITTIGFTTNFQSYLEVQETWLAFLIILCIVEGILLLTLIFLRTRILIAIALIQESSKAISYMMSALLYPVVTFVLLLVCVAYWGATALYLATSGSPTYKVVALNSTMSGCSGIDGTENCDPLNFTSSDYPDCTSASCIFINYNSTDPFRKNLQYLQIYNAVAFLWCVNFVIALGQCTLAGAFASYYWAFEKPSDIPMFPLFGGFIRSLRYHLGSLAFGALILTLVQIMRIILEYIDQKTKGSQNSCARFIMCCLKCCLWCLEKFIKFINRNAYIMIAIYGKNFCVSAKNAFQLLMRNVIRVVVLDKVTDLLLFFGKLMVVGGVGVLSFFFFSGRIKLPGSGFRSENLNYYWMPIITVVLGSYLIAHGFFSVYNMCVDTLFLCFLEDLERNDGSAERPYFMSKGLMKILNKSNKIQKKQKAQD
uniref:Choline transporter-like protein n=1 Tax=Oreochromis niloticus TaxID=8128 RepID=A0A669CCW2_ORENI